MLAAVCLARYSRITILRHFVRLSSSVQCLDFYFLFRFLCVNYDVATLWCEYLNSFSCIAASLLTPFNRSRYLIIFDLLAHNLPCESFNFYLAIHDRFASFVCLMFRTQCFGAECISFVSFCKITLRVITAIWAINQYFPPSMFFRERILIALHVSKLVIIVSLTFSRLLIPISSALTREKINKTVFWLPIVRLSSPFVRGKVVVAVFSPLLGFLASRPLYVWSWDFRFCFRFLLFAKLSRTPWCAEFNAIHCSRRFAFFSRFQCESIYVARQHLQNQPPNEFIFSRMCVCSLCKCDSINAFAPLLLSGRLVACCTHSKWIFTNKFLFRRFLFDRYK